MVTGRTDGVDDTLPIDAVKRAETLEILREGPADRAELMAELDVSRTTIHRTVRALESRDLLVQDGNEFRLSTLGQTVAAEVGRYRRRLLAAQRLQPFLETLPEPSSDLDVGLFEDAEVTVPEPTNPYTPVARFMELLRDSTTLRGFDTTTIAPVYVDDVRDQILGGMETDIVYLPAVVEAIVEAYPEATAAAVESGLLSLSTHDALPFGLAVFDDHVGLGGYDDQTGMLRVFVDTADPDVRSWALDLYHQYREEAEPADLPSSTAN